MGFPDGPAGKEFTCNAGITGDTGSIPGSRRSLEESMATHSTILAWRIIWTKEPGKLQSKGWQTAGHDWMTKCPRFGLIFPKQVCQGLLLACFTSYVNTV